MVSNDGINTYTAKYGMIHLVSTFPMWPQIWFHKKIPVNSSNEKLEVEKEVLLWMTSSSKPMGHLYW